MTLNVYRPEWTDTRRLKIEDYLAKMVQSFPGTKDIWSASVNAFRNYKISFLYEGVICNLSFVPDGIGVLRKVSILPGAPFLEGWMSTLKTDFPDDLYKDICKLFPQTAHGCLEAADMVGQFEIDRSCYWEVVTEQMLAELVTSQ